MAATATAHRLVESIQRADARSPHVDDFFAELSDEVARAIPFDGGMWFGVDPSTLLATAPARMVNMDAAFCWSFWHDEFHEHDSLTFRDLAGQREPADSLRMATGGSPLRSPRYRNFLRPQGYDDEARVVFKTGDTTWAVAGLYREKGRTPFSADELRLLGSVSHVVGVALRSRSVLHSPVTWSARAPGVLLFDAAGKLQSASLEAKAWLSAIYGPDPDGESWASLMARCSMPDRLLSFPVIQPLVSQARAVARGYDDRPARLRFRDRGGRWVVMHASSLDESDERSPVAVVIEPAQSAEIAPIIVEAYGLSARERDIVRCIARGLSTPDIAAQLFLSGHTVRDYIKSIFEKVGVSSRGELTAKLFAEHYSDPFHATMVHFT
jgi:DNA-binding CsgD family transcriptional regulator